MKLEIGLQDRDVLYHTARKSISVSRTA